MNEERRSKVIILKDILRTIEKKDGKAKPTHILYGANLSHDRLKKYLDSLIVEGFIQKLDEDGQVFYTMTDKGKKFLNEFNKMKHFFDAFGIQV
jgi:predicted transcriptional regulator